MSDTVTREQIKERVTAHLHGLSLEDFIRDGIADELTDADQRDLWLMYRDVLVNED